MVKENKHILGLYRHTNLHHKKTGTSNCV